MSSVPVSPINIEFLPDWAREPSTGTQPSSSNEKFHPSKKFSSSRASSSNKQSRPNRFTQKQRGGAPPRMGGPTSNKHNRYPSSNSRDTIEYEGAIKISFLPEPKALNSVGDQIRNSHKAYPLFLLAKMFLEKPERHLVQFRSKIGKEYRPFFQCSICNNISIEENEALSHVFKKHYNLFYEKERVQVETPKGNFSSVAQCQLNGSILGPTNYHAYQSNLMQLYKTQFRHLSFDRFKESIVSVHDPEIVKKWKEDASWKTIYKSIQLPNNMILQSETELEDHFQKNHFKLTVRSISQPILDGPTSRQLDNSDLISIIRTSWKKENRFPLQLAHRLREDFFGMGLHIFESKKDMQFVSSIRPKPLVADKVDLSKTICVILDYIKAHPGIDRKKVIEAVFTAPESASSSTSISQPVTETSSPILQDLHWLIQEGHVIEYNNGVLAVAQQPTPKKQISPPHNQNPLPSEK